MSKQDESLLHLLSHMEFQYMLVIAVNCGGSSCELSPMFFVAESEEKKIMSAKFDNIVVVVAGFHS
jgi:hypothetical protein